MGHRYDTQAHETSSERWWRGDPPFSRNGTENPGAGALRDFFLGLSASHCDSQVSREPWENSKAAWSLGF